MGDLTQRLLAEYPTFDFFQAISLVEEKYRTEKGGADPLSMGKIRFSSDPSTAFPPNDITGIRSNGDRLEFLLSFMGLAGVSSPLPYYFSEHVQRNENISPELMHFLSIFEQRTYLLFYRAWKKYHFMRTLTATGTDPFTRLVASMAGVNLHTGNPAESLRMLAYAGVLAIRARGAAGLQTIITNLFDIPVAVRQWVPRWAQLGTPMRIGIDARLGVNAIAGTRVLDIAGKFRVTLGPLPRETYEAFLPGTHNCTLLKNIINSYQTDPLAFDIEIQLQGTDLVPVVLGREDVRLGVTSSLGRSDRRSDIQSTFTD